MGCERYFRPAAASGFQRPRQGPAPRSSSPPGPPSHPQEIWLAPPGYNAQPAEVQRLEGLLAAAGYARVAAAPTHSGFSAVYLHARVRQAAASVAPFAVGPVAAAELAFAGGDSLVFAGCHLEPFAEGAEERLRQVQDLVRAPAARGAARLILVGDTNMRKAEEPAVAALGLQVRRVLLRPGHMGGAWCMCMRSLVAAEGWDGSGPRAAQWREQRSGQGAQKLGLPLAAVGAGRARGHGRSG